VDDRDGMVGMKGFAKDVGSGWIMTLSGYTELRDGVWNERRGWEVGVDELLREVAGVHDDRLDKMD